MIENAIPYSWTQVRVSDAGVCITGNTPSTKDSSNYGGGVPYIKPPQLNNQIVSTGDESLSEKGAALARVLPENSVLVSCIGNLGRTALNTVPVAFNQQINAIVPNDAIFHKFLFYQAQSTEFRHQLEEKATATTISIVNKGNFEKILVNIAPLNEQKRIVAKIEELFSELDNGIAALKTAREQLKVYRQAVLKHAFEGKLTAQWRKDNADKLESPEQLLTRIQQEREARYQQQVAEWKTAVKAWEASGKGWRKPSMPKAPEQVRLEEAEFQMPSSWSATRLALIAEVSGGLTKNQKRNALPLKMKYLRVANVYADRLLLDDIQEIGVTEAEEKKVSLALNDLLVVEGNGSVEQIGRVSLWDASIQNCGHQNHLIRVRLDNPEYARFVLLFLLSPIGRDLIVKEASSTSGLHTLSISKVSNLQVPLVSLSEAAEVMKVVDEKLTLTSKFEDELDTEIQRAETLRQSILKKAFSGQLVPQDPDDEPASELLARIQAEKATKKAELKAAGKAKAARKPRAKRSTKSTEATP